MGGGCSREDHPEGGYVFHHKDLRSVFNAAAHPVEHHTSGGSTINASFPYLRDNIMKMDGGALRTSSDCDGWHTNDMDSIFIHGDALTENGKRAVIYLRGKDDDKNTWIYTHKESTGWRNVGPMNYYNTYVIKENHYAEEPKADEVYIDKHIPKTQPNGGWDYDFVSKKRKIINKYCPEADVNKSGWIRTGVFRFIYNRQAIERLHKKPEFKSDWGRLTKMYCYGDIDNRIDHKVGIGYMKNAEGKEVDLTCLATDQSLGDKYCRGPKEGDDAGSNIEKTICRAYDDFELVASQYCKTDARKTKDFCGCANAVEIDYCDNFGEAGTVPGCAETESLWKEINNGLMDRDKRFFKNRRKCHENVCNSSRYQPTGWENGCDASYVVCTNNANIKGDLINSNYSVTQDCKINTKGEMEYDGNVGKRTPENIFVDDATKETKLFEKIFSVEGEKHDAWYERRMYHIMSSSSSCIIAILMGMGLIVI